MELEHRNYASDKLVDDGRNADKAINYDVLDVSFEFVDWQPGSSREFDFAPSPALPIRLTIKQCAAAMSGIFAITVSKISRAATL